MMEAYNLKNKIKLEVETAGELGYYLYVFNIGEKVCFEDHLCDNLEQVYSLAEEDFQIYRKDFVKK